MMAVMARTPDHPSGKTIAFTARISPAHLQKLDALAAESHRSRSKLVMHILDRLPDPVKAEDQ